MKHSSIAPVVVGTAAALGAALVPVQADADIIYNNTPINVPNTFDGIYINLGTGGTGALGANIPGWDFNPYNSGASLSFFWNANTAPNGGGGVAATATTGPYLSLALGTTIGPASVFTNVTATAATAAFQPTGSNILGVRFFNEATGTMNYGWVRLTSAGTNGFPLTVTDFAYENTGATIQAGQTAVPEPSTVVALGMMAVGALGLRQWRRKAA